MDLRKAESNFSDMAKLLELIFLNCFGLVGWLVANQNTSKPIYTTIKLQSTIERQ